MIFAAAALILSLPAAVQEDERIQKLIAAFSESSKDERTKAVDELAKTVLQVKSQGDKATAEKLKASYVDGEGEWKKVREVIAERWLRAPKASFVYSVKL